VDTLLVTTSTSMQVAALNYRQCKEYKLSSLPIFAEQLSEYSVHVTQQGFVSSFSHWRFLTHNSVSRALAASSSVYHHVID
jgi:hypothetical protein